MKKIRRRTFFCNSLMAAATLSLPSLPPGFVTGSMGQMPVSTAPPDAVPVIDTNVNLLGWPFRHLKYGQTGALVEKLGRHRINEAWAGSFEALFHKDIDGVNARLAEACQARGKGMLRPFGTVNLAWPGWEEDLRRCHEVYKMPGIRLYPVYQTFDLSHPSFPRLVHQAAKRGLILQIVGDMADSRHHHPIVKVRDMNVEPLIGLMAAERRAKIQLLYWNHRVGRGLLEKLIARTNVVLDISRVEGAGAIGRLIEGRPWSGTAAPVPAERLLFGSHAPYFPVEANLLKLFESPLSLQQLKAIMRNNALHLMAHT